MDAAAAIGRWIDHVYTAYLSPDAEAVLWSPSLGASWHDDAEALVSRAVEWSERAEVYLGVCLHSRDLMIREAGRRGAVADPRKRRGYAESTVLMPGVVIDFDLAFEGRSSSRLFGSLEDVEATIARLPIPPTSRVATGGGVHGWWLFREPIDLRKERDVARTVARSWTELVRAEADRAGADLDSTFDFARVMRLPGTKNRKTVHGEAGVPVDVCGDLDGPRSNPMDFEAWFGLVSAEMAPASTSVVMDGIVLTPDAEPPAGLLEAAFLFSPEFREIWHGARSYQSQSEADLAIASHTVRMGWPTQEVVNALIAHRRRNGEKSKLRATYFSTTIGKVHSSILAERGLPAPMSGTMPDLYPVGRQTSQEAPGSTPTNGRVPGRVWEHTGQPGVLEAVSRALGLCPEGAIVRFQKILGETSSYTIRLADDRVVTLPSSKHLLSFAMFRERWFDGTDRALVPIGKKQWLSIVQGLANAIEHVYLEESSDLVVLMQERLEEFLSRSSFAEDLTEGCRSRMPWRERGGAIYMHLQPFLQWLEVHAGDKVPRRTVELAMRLAGCQREKVNYEAAEGKRTSRSVYRVQAGYSEGMAQASNPTPL